MFQGYVLISFDFQVQPLQFTTSNSIVAAAMLLTQSGQTKRSKTITRKAWFLQLPGGF